MFAPRQRDASLDGLYPRVLIYTIPKGICFTAVDAAKLAATQAAGLNAVFVEQLVIPVKKAASLGGLVA